MPQLPHPENRREMMDSFKHSLNEFTYSCAIVGLLGSDNKELTELKKNQKALFGEDKQREGCDRE